MRHKTYAPASKKVIAGLGPDNRPENIGAVIAARPEMVGEGGMVNASPVAFPRSPTPREVRREIAHRQPFPQLPRTNRQPIKKPNWGLGTSIASGLPKVKYRHNWSND
jgi:hypothetical protein